MGPLAGRGLSVGLRQEVAVGFDGGLADVLAFCQQHRLEARGVRSRPVGVRDPARWADDLDAVARTHRAEHVGPGNGKVCRRLVG